MNSLAYDTPGRAMAAITQALEDHFQYLSHLGVNGFDCRQDTLELMKQWGKKKQVAPESLEAIKQKVSQCTQCGFSATRTRVVFGNGSPKARLVFVGDWPGIPEDREGEPFLEEAGDLLTKIIGAIKLTRESVYLTNVVKCRPSDGHILSPGEVKACLGFLKRQICAINPEFICTLGTFAAQSLLGTNLPVSKLRGRFYDFLGIKLMATYHPVLLLQEPGKKRDVWEDMKRLMAAF